jgi:Rod binding domain-containing protein
MISPITSAALPPSTTALDAAATSQSKTADPRVQKAARDFEAIFVRQMLKPLEKTTAAGAGVEAQAGENTYGSMIVGALADAISKAGGLGLADEIGKSLARTLGNTTK